MRLHVMGTGLMLVVALTLTTGCEQTAAQSKVRVMNAIDAPASTYMGASSTLSGAGGMSGHDRRTVTGPRAMSAAAVGLGGPLAVKSGSAYVGETSAQVLLRPGGLPGSRLGGDATFVLSKTHDLTVTLHLTGLAPSVPYQSALTDALGRLLCDLGPVVPTRGQPGRGSSVTLIHNVTAIQPTWRVMVDQGYR